MRITVKCECGKELKTSNIYNTVICDDCGKENVIEKNACHGCEDYFSGVGTGFCLKAEGCLIGKED